jgi:hypothetical protein
MEFGVKVSPDGDDLNFKSFATANTFLNSTLHTPHSTLHTSHFTLFGGFP